MKPLSIVFYRLWPMVKNGQVGGWTWPGMPIQRVMKPIGVGKSGNIEIG